jgi:hypothetical protein
MHFEGEREETDHSWKRREWSEETDLKRGDIGRKESEKRRCCVGMGCVELSQSNTPTKGKRFL